MSLNQSDASAPNPGFVPSLPINDFSFLNSCEEEFELVKKWREKGDTRAVNRLITSHKRLVEKIAYGYSGYGLCMEELIAEGYVGMMQAVEKFDTEKVLGFLRMPPGGLKRPFKNIFLIHGLWSNFQQQKQQKNFFWPEEI